MSEISSAEYHNLTDDENEDNAVIRLWNDEFDLEEKQLTRTSSSASSLLECRICGDDDQAGRLISPCQCTGSISRVHAHCLEKWIMERPVGGVDMLSCEICHGKYRISLTRKLKCDLDHIFSCTAFAHCAEGLILILSLSLMCFVLFFLAPRIHTKHSRRPSERAVLIALFSLTVFLSVLALRKVFLRWHDASSVPVIVS